jgi:hypothetical protein
VTPSNRKALLQKKIVLLHVRVFDVTAEQPIFDLYVVSSRVEGVANPCEVRNVTVPKYRTLRYTTEMKFSRLFHPPPLALLCVDLPFSSTYNSILAAGADSDVHYSGDSNT